MELSLQTGFISIQSEELNRSSPSKNMNSSALRTTIAIHIELAMSGLTRKRRTNILVLHSRPILSVGAFLSSLGQPFYELFRRQRNQKRRLSRHNWDVLPTILIFSVYTK